MTGSDGDISGNIESVGAAGDFQKEELSVPGEVTARSTGDGAGQRELPDMILQEAMIEVMHGHVSEGVLNPSLYQTVSKLKSFAEQFGFKRVVGRSRYVYPKDRSFVSMSKFNCIGTDDVQCGFQPT